jgi:hypothetical protein
LSIPFHQKEIKVTLQQKLASLGIFLNETSILPPFVDNFNLPSIPFTLGFWLGDGTLGIILDNPKARYPMFYIKLHFSLYQQSSDYTLHMFTLISKSLSNYFEVSICSKTNGMSTLSISGLKVATLVLPLLAQFSPYLYWKIPQFQLTYQVSQFVLNKSHLTREGLLQIINLLYSFPINSRKEPIEYWLDLIEKAFPLGSKPRRGSQI